MKVTRRLKILLGILALVVLLSAILVAVDLLPALAKMRQKREELKRIEAEIQRSLLEVRLQTDGTERDRPAEIPELPEIAAFIASLKRAQEKTGVEEMAFDAVHTEKQEITLMGGEVEEFQEYVVSRLDVSLSASLLEAAGFLARIQAEGPDEMLDYLRIVSKSPDRDWLDVSMAVRLHGIPR
ncbi:MAG: hypothetical protein PVJ42_02635 [bacterium]|jgi:hypothetical protein